MFTVLNNTQRDFHAFTAPSPGSSALTLTVVHPGFNTLNDQQMANMRTDSHFMRAIAMDAVIISGNETDVRAAEVKPIENVPESPDEKIEKELAPIEIITPVVEEPVIEEPVIEEPVIEEPVIEEPPKKSKKSRKRKSKKSDDAFKDFE